jgi:hypothetical protein
MPTAISKPRRYTACQFYQPLWKMIDFVGELGIKETITRLCEKCGTCKGLGYHRDKSNHLGTSWKGTALGLDRQMVKGLMGNAKREDGIFRRG